MRRVLVVAAVVLVPVVAFVLVWFQPQKLLYDDRVVEQAPTGAEVLSTGSFGDRAHHASGTVTVLREPGGAHLLRLSGLDVENGPDLYVYLTEAAPDAPNAAFGKRFVSLGRLKGNQGDQTYSIPEGTDLARYGTVAIWCKRFSTVFGTAALSRT
jgi:hypothetical protein